ncbi:MAG: AarF/ABC1/UbiB kinase family protein [Algiphilus sp.]|nr:AarF/ABC1/UbiB kinase family protein [Algiphilus sp.]
MGSEDDKPRRASMDRLTTRPMARNWAMTRLGMGTGARFAAHSFGNLFRDASHRKDADRDFYRDEAGKLADALGNLKGSVMKAGQMLSLYAQYFLPPEAVDVLSGLQDDTAPVSWSVIEPVLQRGLGDKRLAEIEVDRRPLAAASLGQAHRARRRSDGTELVLKIQYPGVGDAIESDVRTLKRLLSMTRLAPRGLDMEPVFNEVREMLHREVDYASEARYTKDYARRLADDARFIVPRVYDEYSADMVLALSYEPGVSIRHASVAALPQDTRNDIAYAFIEIFLREFFSWGMVQTDPHFGNYRIRLADDAPPRIVLLDFGATRIFGRGFIEGYRRLLSGALFGPRDDIFEGAMQIGLMEADHPRAVLDAFAELVELIMEPFRQPDEAGANPELLTPDGAYRFADSDLLPRAAQKVARNSLSRWFRVPPREIVFLHRRLAGAFMACGVLGAELKGRAMLMEALGIDDPNPS